MISADSIFHGQAGFALHQFETVVVARRHGTIDSILAIVVQGMSVAIQPVRFQQPISIVLDSSARLHDLASSYPNNVFSSLSLNRRRRLAANIMRDTVDTVNLIDDSTEATDQQIVGMVAMRPP